MISHKKKILFVDDEEKWCEMASEYLAANGYEVLTAQSGTRALFIGQGTPLDLFILDVHLAGENGVALMVLLRRNHPKVPVILYTGQVHDQQAIQAMLDAGANKYLRKGNLQELLNAVRSFMEIQAN